MASSSAAGGVPPLSVRMTLPSWVRGAVSWDGIYPDDAAKMTVAVDLAGGNVAHGTGGPFGAAVFRRDTNRLVAVGVNAVVAATNSVFHAELIALILAEQVVGAYTLRGEGLPDSELFTSCEPCAMCLGAILWSGVRRVVSGATREDARAVGFDEGPVFPESYRYLEGRGIVFVRGVERTRAMSALRQYARSGGEIYNG